MRKANNTTKKLTQITVDQQLQWHTTLDSAIDELKRPNQPNDEFVNFIEYFIGNLDDPCIISENGKIYVVVSSGNNKTEKISYDYRESVTKVQMDFASGQQREYLFLEKGKNMDRSKFINLHKYFKAPELSEVSITNNAFVNDESCLDIIPKVCKSIRRQEIIWDHPYWWVLLSLDGFTSHVNVLNAHEIFVEFKMNLIKEEGDTSHVCQE